MWCCFGVNCGCCSFVVVLYLTWIMLGWINNSVDWLLYYLNYNFIDLDYAACVLFVLCFCLWWVGCGCLWYITFVVAFIVRLTCWLVFCDGVCFIVDMVTISCWFSWFGCVLILLVLVLGLVLVILSILRLFSVGLFGLIGIVVLWIEFGF